MKSTTHQEIKPFDAGRHEILRKLVSDIGFVVPGQKISILIRDPLSGAYRTTAGDRSSCLPNPNTLNWSDPVIGRLIRGEEWVRTANGHRTRGNECGRRGARFTAFPISMRGCVEYILMIKGSCVTDRDARMIRAFCRQTVLAIETLSMQLSLDRKIDRLASLVSLVDDTAVEQNYHELLRTVLERSAELLLAEQSSLMLIDKETDLLLLEAARGAPRDGDRQIRVPKGVGIAGRVAASGEPILVANIECDPRIGRKNRDRYKSPSFVSVPLRLGRRVVGVMNFNDKRAGELFDTVDLKLALTCASHAAVVLDRRRIYEQTARLTRQATIDDLTGLLNRGCFLERLKEELARSERYGKMMSLVMVDIDGFKKINDLFGHARGDFVLQRTAEIMSNAVRSVDVIGRYGGDEFVIILPETDTFFASHMAERLRSDVVKAELVRGPSNDTAVKVTVSIGIATFPSHGTLLDVLVDHADEALYRAKEAGRDQVVVY